MLNETTQSMKRLFYSFQILRLNLINLKNLRGSYIKDNVYETEYQNRLNLNLRYGGIQDINKDYYDV